VCEIIGQADGGLSVLRTFRLLRVIKLVRFMPALRRQLVVLMKTMDNVATFCMLLMLFIFIFSILGMHIFGCKFSLKTEAGDTVPDRKNFDSLLWAIVTVFQILTQEDWNMVLYNGMASTSPCAALYFVALMTFGNYVLFNLLVAILVEGFQAEGDANRSYSDDDRSSCNFEENDKKDLLRLSDPKICTLTPNGHLDLPLVPALYPRETLFPGETLYRGETLAWLGARKTSVISLGRSDLEQRGLYLDRGYHHPHHWGRSLEPRLQALWARRSSWNTYSPSTPTSPTSSTEPRPLYGHAQGRGSLRVRGPRAASSPHHYHHHHPHWGPRDEESLLLQFGPPPSSPRPLHLPPLLLPGHFVPRRDRRALSLELPHLLQLPAPPRLPPLPLRSPPLPLLPPGPLHAQPRKKSCTGGLLIGGGAGGGALASDHQDCNGKTPLAQLLQPPPLRPAGGGGASSSTQLMAEVFPQVNTRRKDQEDLDDETDYSLCFRVQKMLEVYRPDWCETREEWSVFLFSPENKFRQLCQAIIAHKLFDYIVLAFIFSNCITVALERPKILQGSLERVFLTISNYIFTAIFVSEMTLKVVSMGFYLGEQTYLRSSWNVLDGFLVFVSLIDIVVSMAGGAKILGVLRVLRLLRTLRPLRVISRAPGLKLVVETLITSLKPIGNIVLICCAFFIIFGILGVQLFKGKFFYCFGLDVRNITNRSDCLQANYKWVHHKYNFDNLGQALMSLFVLASKDGWVNIMYHGLDAVGVDQQPVTNNNPWMLLYFISFLLIVSFFVLNMFVGVVVENFHKCRQHQEVEEAKRREEKRQRRMEKKRRNAQKLPYYSSYSRVRLMVHTLCTNHWLDLIITFIICFNVITMSLEHYSQPRSLDLVLKYCNYFFTSTFVLESILKLIAFGFRGFFKERWNQLDLAIVLLSVMGITLEEIEISSALPINPTIIRIMRVLRIARVLKLLKMATGMRALLDTVVQALPQVGNLGLLFMLLFFIYAALGVELFGELVCNEDYPCEGMSRHATFENFGMAFLTLFQVSTGDNWNGIMKDTLRECPPDHSGVPGGIAGGAGGVAGVDYACNPSLQFISPLYFVSFVLTAQFVLINVVVAVLMKHLDDSNKEAKEEAEMDAEIELELAQGTLCCMGAPGCGGGGGSAPPEKVCPGGKDRGGGGGAPGRRDDEGGGRKATRHRGTAHPPQHGPLGSSHSSQKQYSPAQESQWLDSVSLLIKDSLEGEMQMIDNLSGSVFHHYSSPPPVCRDCRVRTQEQIQMAEIEQASLRSEPQSDKSSSPPPLPDDLCLEEGAGRYQLLLHSDHKGARSNSDSQSSEEAGGFHQAGDTQTQTQVGLERPSLTSGEAQEEEEAEEEGRALMELMELEVQADQQYHQQHHQRSPGGVSSSRGRSAEGDEERREGSGGPLSRFPLPVDFFHPVAVPIPAPPRSRSLRLTRGLRLTSPATWASLRSPGARNTTLCTQVSTAGAPGQWSTRGLRSVVHQGPQHPSHSDSSLATGSSEGSLQTTLEEGLSFSVSPPRNLDPPFPLAPLPLLFPSLTLHGDDPAAAGPPQGPRPPSGLTLQATRGHQRSQSSGRGSASPGCTREDSMDPSDEDLGIGIGPSLGGCGCGQAGNSEHLSETLSSLSLTSLLSPGSLAPRGGGVKKCSSTGSLEQGGALLSSRGREGHKGVLGLELMDPQGFLANPSMGLGDGRGSGGRRGDGGRGGGQESFSLKSSNQLLVGPRRKNR
ncbi:unnamed protein product, partial [Arctogadus glacialis]